MGNDKRFQKDGLELVRTAGPFAELYFDWKRLPSIDLSREYYLVEIVPESRLLPTEYARPNSAGPLYFCLKEAVRYRLNLLCVPHLDYQVHTELEPLPQVDLIQQHESLQKLVWGNIDLQALKKKSSADYLEILVEDKLYEQVPIKGEACCHIAGRPEKIEVRLERGSSLFRVITNFGQVEAKKTLDFVLDKTSTRLFLSTVINPDARWRIRAEIPTGFQMRLLWRDFYRKRFPRSNPASLVGTFRFYEDGQLKRDIRQWGFCTRIRTGLVDQIQLEEWKDKQRKPVRGYRLQLQISSAHRELYKAVLLEKDYNPDIETEFAGFSEEEIEEAENVLFNINHHVSWDQAFLELVVWFKVDGREWQEFQRETAHSLKWDYIPDTDTKECRCEWVLRDLENRDNNHLIVLKSGLEKRMAWPSHVFLKPYHASRLMACWDLDQKTVETAIDDRWKVELKDVGFYLKVHEEHLGNRVHRGDLDCLLIELFSLHQNVYFDVESTGCFSAEIVARHKTDEMALTPVSRSIATPRKEEDINVGEGPGRSLDLEWYHFSQREVRHLHGSDGANRAKILLHLHLHSPNLFRADPFREGYLRDNEWPVRTNDGAEVHNPPGEWAMKNCLDSWLPLLRLFRKLARENMDYQVSLDISPPVAYMLANTRFKDYMSRYLMRMQAYVRERIALMKSRRDPPDYIWAAERYLADVEAVDRFFNHELKKDIIGAFRELELKGFLEIVTCTVTHAMPAELESIPDSLNTQIVLAARSHHRIFGDRPRGIWLAENSFFPGVEHYLEKESLNFFFVEAEAVLFGSHQPREEEFNPVVVPNSQVVAFARSRLGRMQVWDAELGYAGHPDFREYHFRHLGLPIKRITSKTSLEKHPYNPDKAESTARDLAGDFYHKLSQKAHELSQRSFKSIPLITCSYDAELFGHHWAEGPLFLEELLREFHRQGDAIGLTTASHYLANRPPLPELIPNPSTWGHEAVHVRWTDPRVSWIFRELERADGVLRDYLGLAQQDHLTDFQKRAVEQMAAELVRSQSSDLTFVIMSGDFEEDMQREICKYFDYFYRLKHLVDNDIENEEFLTFRQYENDMFPEIPEYYKIR
ncbi:MAG: DUF1957 domain-containing protein [Proteobacteria bacterium]|nr:DUF1957 domain-containing protein [Pseudomonadota bacterium]